MKKIHVLITLLSLLNFAFAQKKATLHYQLCQDIYGRNDKSSLQQYYQNGKSLELPIISDVKSDTVVDGLTTNIKQIIRVDRNRLPFILKTAERKSLIYAKEIWTKPTQLVTDTFNKFKWKILNETKNIGNVNCTKAETYFRGRNYVAWFKKDSNIQTGPWKFGGLPGIIYEVQDTDGMFKYELTGIELVDSFPIELKTPEGYKDNLIITHGEFMALWKANKIELEKDNDKVEYTFTGSNTIKTHVAPIQELY
ncbi:GLPGLI family protein [Pedobacter endophyticus]|uniref:GLPGLI family protein n=1 Tax=Pedobacter endophyticus TaxID=2789740 RepID=A0A7S9KYJ4_9SPHI|nr:GLPGLI family protein [Pedobacter endophyticus]QPH39205.1 GLPGLI family protein [Pedobacter endophyticus]